MFDVYVLEKDTDPNSLPQEGTYYLITADGPFLHKDTDLFTAMVKVDTIPFLGTVQPKVLPKMEKIPPEVLLKAWLFFRKVFRQRHAESELDLYYHKERKEYLLVCRPQGVTFGSVNYGRSRAELISEPQHLKELLALTAAGYRKVGTIHSHCSFEAFHSSTDERDESDKDGIHITVGHVNQPTFSLVVSWAVNNNRFPMDPEDFILGVKSMSPPRRAEKRYQEEARFFNITMPMGEQEKIEDDFQPTLDEWLEMVGDRQPRRYPQAYSQGWVAGNPPEEEEEVVDGEEPEDFLEEDDEYIEEDVVIESVPVLALVETRDLRQVRSHAFALLNNKGQIPELRVQELTETLRIFFKKSEITPNDINLAARVNPGRRIYDGEKADA